MATDKAMGVVVHGLCYTVEFSVVFLTFILSFDFLFQFYEGHLLVEALINIPSLYHLQWVNEANAGYRLFLYSLDASGRSIMKILNTAANGTIGKPYTR